MASLYEQIVQDIEDQNLKKEIITSLAFFGSEITTEKIDELREKINNKFKNKNVPRKLSEEEIKDVVDFSIPKVPAVFDVISEDNNRQIKEFITEELRERKLVVTEDNLEKLKNEMREVFYRSLVSPGDSVGVEVAMSFGQPLTQMNLDTFHQAGTSSELGSGVKSLQELFNVSSTRKKNLTTIHFKDKDLTREEIHIQGKMLKGVNVKSLLESSEIKYVESRGDLEDMDGSNDNWWYENYISMFQPETELREAVFKYTDEDSDILQNLKTYHVHEDKPNGYISKDKLIILYDPLVTTQEEIRSDVKNGKFIYSRSYFKMDRFLRLRINVLKCYNYGITINDIVSSLKDETITCIASPLNIGIIDIHPNEDYIQESLAKFAEKGKIKFSSCERRTGKLKSINLEEQQMSQSKILFLTVIIENCLSEIYIKGIKGINNIIPITENVVNNLKTKRVVDIDTLLKYNKYTLWYIRLNYMKMKYNGIPEHKVLDLCKNSNIPILENNIFTVDGKLSRNPHLIVDIKEDPKSIISMNFSQAERYVKQQVKQMTLSPNETQYALPDYPEIYRNAFYNYAYAEGEKIVRKLMRHTKLDNKLILPNNPNEICDIFGIESARLYMVREYVHLIESSDSYVTPVNIELLVDYQTAMGFLTPIHAIGSSKQGTSTLSAATFNDPIGAFQKAAAIGKSDKINSISSCIMAGKRSLNGTGLSDVHMNNEGEHMVDEFPRDFSKEEEFCEQRYVISDNTQIEPVDINIEKLLNNVKEKENKFSTENVPTIVPVMDTPDFLDDEPSTKPEQEPVELNKPPTPETVILVDIPEEDESDFEIPDAIDDIGELRDF